MTIPPGHEICDLCNGLHPTGGKKLPTEIEKGDWLFTPNDLHGRTLWIALDRPAEFGGQAGLCVKARIDTDSLNSIGLNVEGRVHYVPINDVCHVVSFVTR